MALQVADAYTRAERHAAVGATVKGGAPGEPGAPLRAFYR